MKAQIRKLGRWLADFGGQTLITSAGVSMTAAFSTSHGVLDPAFAWAMAIGFELSWLRALAHSGRVRGSKWVKWTIATGALSVGIYGVLWGLIRYDVVPSSEFGGWGWVLALAHVVPIVVMNYCAANIHREIAELEQRDAETAAKKAQQRADAQADALAEIELENARHAAELERQRAADQLKLETALAKANARIALRGGGVRPLTAARPAAGPPVPAQATYPAPQPTGTPQHVCPRCSAPMTPQQFGHMISCEQRGARWKGCLSCRTR